MRYRDKPELQDRLAAEYALGTLRGPARARFRRWLAQDAALARRAEEWTERLAPLSHSVATVRPPARLWRAIAARLGAAPGGIGLWQSLAFWRGLGLAASGAAASLLFVLVELGPGAPQPAPAPIVLRVPSNEMPATYLAVLSDPRTRKPMLIAAAGRTSDQLWVKTLDPSINVPDRSLELWAIMPAGQAPKSLGMVSKGGKTMLPLHAVADRSLGDVPMLAVSLEPMGGSPTGAPTGPVMYSGPCVKVW
ncbi:MAG: anti-sigma factor [Burkholderiales bacterium]